ncbi:hypothetical protein CPJCM30710_13830 [Clostridium polyendosporum]|uniref:Uncharacterized protein n=2 Tax=Clostridium polyendosporum TaxID=69208 RepID=A0A919RYR4_9CLOT|nr:hypothetical protein CPJCM30710_13830 [Clostridium polyendosporum]
MLTPEKKVEPYSGTVDRSAQDILFQSAKVNISDLSARIRIDENRLDELIASTNQVKDFKSEIKDKKVNLYVNTKVLDIVPSQYKLILDAYPQQNNLILKLNEAYLGRVKLANKTVMSVLKQHESQYVTIDEDQSLITVKNPYVMVKNVDFEDDVLGIFAYIDKSKLPTSIQKQIDSLKNILVQ